MRRRCRVAPIQQQNTGASVSLASGREAGNKALHRPFLNRCRLLAFPAIRFCMAPGRHCMSWVQAFLSVRDRSSRARERLPGRHAAVRRLAGVQLRAVRVETAVPLPLHGTVRPDRSRSGAGRCHPSARSAGRCDRPVAAGAQIERARLALRVQDADGAAAARPLHLGLRRARQDDAHGHVLRRSVGAEEATRAFPRFHGRRARPHPPVAATRQGREGAGHRSDRRPWPRRSQPRPGCSASTSSRSTTSRTR